MNININDDKINFEASKQLIKIHMVKQGNFAIVSPSNQKQEDD
uniref:Uncharacterized protein n=1 Tax=Rhizophora mucronata TaxID=61149 RepID=A0A2P2NWX0_RHIMU